MIPRVVSLTGVTEWQDGQSHLINDYLVGEEPLAIQIGDKSVSVTMRTPGNDLELATGFLVSEGVITQRSQIVAARHAADARQNGANRVRIDLVPEIELNYDALQRNFNATSSCGVCGKASIDSVRICCRPVSPISCPISPELLCLMLDQFRVEQHVFNRTGALHAAGLFTLDGELLVLREDVGRHNAVDKVIGWALAHDLLPLSQSILLVSGRGGFEVVQKALVAGVPVLACVSAPSDLAVNLARQHRMTLIGFLRERRFVIYAGADRVAMPPVTKKSAVRVMERDLLSQPTEGAALLEPVGD